MILKHPVLYSFRRCPYAMRARMALLYANQNVEIREILLKDKPQSMLEYSSKGTVPVLILENETVIDESFNIMTWALEKHDPDNWLGENTNLINHYVHENDQILKPALDRYKYPNRFPEENLSGAQEQCKEILFAYNSRLKETNYLISDTISLADIAIFPFVRQCAFVDKDWFDNLQLTALNNWLDNHLTSDLFMKIMEKYKVWEPEHAPKFLIN